MYQDPKRVRHHKFTVYMDDYEAAIIHAHANYSGLSLAETMRQMMLSEAQESLGIDPVSLTHKVTAQAS